MDVLIHESTLQILLFCAWNTKALIDDDAVADYSTEIRQAVPQIVTGPGECSHGKPVSHTGKEREKVTSGPDKMRSTSF